MLILRTGRLAVTGNNDARVLSGAGINCEYAETGREALESLRLYDYDIALVDLELPDMSGHEMIRLVRANGLATPSIVFANAASRQVKVKALDQGADDFVTTPCDPDELLARIRAVIRRGQRHDAETPVIHLGPLELKLDRREAWLDGKTISVSRREFSVLELLSLNPGTILKKGAFYKHLYNGMEDVETKTIDVVICRLRKKLAMAGLPNLISTIWGVGYISYLASDVDDVKTVAADTWATPLAA